MDLESIACPVDGAIDGFIQVELDTYYCPYHHGLFKLAATGQAKAVPTGYFCSCGNAIKFKCQVCANGMCAECDVIESCDRLLPSPEDERSTQGRLESFHTYGRLIFLTRGFGYREVVQHTKAWVVKGNRIEQIKVTGSVIGPFLTLKDISPQLGIDPETVRHLCYACTGKAIPATAAAIAEGQTCEHPGCGAAAPGEQCKCCEGSFCTPHFRDNVAMLHEVAWDREDWHSSPQSARLATIARDPQRRSRMMLGSDGRAYQAPDLADRCAMCVDEAKMLAWERIEASFKENPLSRVFRPRRKAREVVDQFDSTPRPCHRNRLYDQQAAIARMGSDLARERLRADSSLHYRDFMISTYRVHDERDRISPGLAV